MKFFFLGQVSMANRGCEALIRSNTRIIREKYPEARLLCPTRDRVLDIKQWPNAEAEGIDFVPIPRFPNRLKAWAKIYSRFPNARSIGVLPLPLDAQTRQSFEDCDAVLMTGGDIISLDYGVNTLYFWAGMVDAAHRMGKPTHLLAASVGPFSKDPIIERQMVDHLKRYTSISVRETASLEYLKKLGIRNVRLVADPAFVMEPEVWDTTGIIDGSRDVVGFNVSPLVRKFRKDDASRQSFDAEIQAFIRNVISTTSDDVLLIPHVDPLVGSDDNSDRAYMAQLLAGLGDVGGRVKMTPDLLNAAQIKYALGRCRYFIGARTHATIGALSQYVPTVSIAYSVKAIGINRDLFGTTDYVLPTPDVTAQSLGASLSMLKDQEKTIKDMLAMKVPEWRKLARTSIESFNL